MTNIPIIILKFFNSYRDGLNRLKKSQLQQGLDIFTPEQLKLFDLISNKFKQLAEAAGADNARKFLESLEDLSKQSGVGTAQLVQAIIDSNDTFGLILDDAGKLKIVISKM